jgi:predicted membrane protein
MNTKTKKITAMAMFCALAYVAVAVGRVPLVLFLKYEPKDVILTIGGLIFGPLSVIVMSVIVAFVEMITISTDGIIGFIMNCSGRFYRSGSLRLQKKVHYAQCDGGTDMFCYYYDRYYAILELFLSTDFHGLSA